MKAKAIRPFTMGNSSYQKDQVIDLPEERVHRLIGEGLVVALETQPSEESKASTSEPAAQESETVVTPAPDAGPVESKATPKSKKSKKKKS